MLTIFTKKKIREDKLAKVLVNALLKLTANGFKEVAAAINEDPEFRTRPNIDPANDHHFLLIITSGNLTVLDRYLNSGTDGRVKEYMISLMAEAMNISSAQLNSQLTELKGLMRRVNHPSKNVIYAMSKALFFRYDLIRHQQEYFVNMNTPNPVSRKKIDDLMQHFLWDWDSFLDDYKIT